MGVSLPEAAATGSHFCCMVQPLGAPKARAKGQGRRLPPMQRDTRAPSASLRSQPIRLPGHAASEGQEVKALMHMRRQPGAFASTSKSFGDGFKRQLLPSQPAAATCGAERHVRVRREFSCAALGSGHPWGGPQPTSALLHSHEGSALGENAPKDPPPAWDGACFPQMLLQWGRVPTCCCTWGGHPRVLLQAGGG